MHNIDLLHKISPLLVLIAGICSLLLLTLIKRKEGQTTQSTINIFFNKNLHAIRILLGVTIIFCCLLSFNFSSQTHLKESTSPSGNLTVKLNADLNEIKVFAKNNTEEYPHYTKVTNVRLTVGMESITSNDAVISWEDDVLTILIFNSAGDYNIKVWIDPSSNTIKHTKKIENTI
ncbi:MAG: hypothetical protein ACRDD7_07890 [Peptostreptococcaceae bacterium]